MGALATKTNGAIRWRPWAGRGTVSSMRAHRAFWGPVSPLKSLVVVTLFIGATVFAPPGCVADPCCQRDVDCATGATCFEGVCHRRCDDTSGCLEGEFCAEGVCLAKRRDPHVCAYVRDFRPTFEDAGPGDDDGGQSDDGGIDDDAGVTDCPGVEEPNDTLADAAIGVTEGAFDLCNDDDVDIFEIDVTGPATIDIRLTFVHADGDLDLQLLDANGTDIERSQGITNEERIVKDVESAGLYYARVYGFAGSVNAYTIRVSTSPLDFD